jgi:hypothetical protein
MIKRIHVNQHVVRANKLRAHKLPIFTVKEGNTNRYGTEVQVMGPSRIVYAPDKPLSCGAHAWIETTSEVIIVGEMSWSDIKAAE